MNYRLLVLLSLLGLLLALANVFIIPPSAEFVCWLIVFVVSGILIAWSESESLMMHGIFVGLLDSGWVLVVNILLYGHFYHTHSSEVSSMMDMGVTPSIMFSMILLYPVAGFLGGIFTGLVAIVLGLVIKPRRTA